MPHSAGPFRVVPKGSLLVVLLIGITALILLALFGSQRLAVGMLVGAALGYCPRAIDFSQAGGYTGDCLGLRNNPVSWVPIWACWRR